MHLRKGSWDELLSAEKAADANVAAAAGESDPAEATVTLLFAIEARLKMLTIVARDTVRPIRTFLKEDGHEAD